MRQGRWQDGFCSIAALQKTDSRISYGYENDTILAMRIESSLEKLKDTCIPFGSVKVKKEEKMGKKLIFLDIDGTLTRAGSNEPPASALEAVRRAQKKGHYVFLCTGRNYAMLSPLLQFGFDGAIASSGGYIFCGDKVIYDCPMTEAQRKTVMEVFYKNGVFRTIECKDGSYTDEGFKIFLRENAKQGANSELLRWREQIEHDLNILPMKQYRGQDVYKLVFMSSSLEQLEEPKRVLQGNFDFCIQDADGYGMINGELVNRKFNKGKGIERVCEYLNLSVNDTIGFGDSMNDREMLETVGLSFCMENGSKKLKELADEICPSVENDGLYQGFLKYGLA